MTSSGLPLVLASGSETRRSLLEGAGVRVRVHPADIDETALRDDMLAADATVSHESIAAALAEAKAKAVNADETDALVIGADQVLSFEGRVFEKPKSIAAARAQLVSLRGKTHALHSSVALATGGKVVWRHTESARLTLRPFSDAALDAYLASAGDGVLTSVGAYKIEGPAIQLFERIEGDHATILGLPLLPLIRELVARGVLIP